MTTPTAWYEAMRAELLAEIGRLQREYGLCQERIIQHAAEIERHMREKVELAGLVAKEREDNERLRAACQAVVNTCHGAGAEHWAACELARRALEPKP